LVVIENSVNVVKSPSVTVLPPLCRNTWPGWKSSRKWPVFLRMTRAVSLTGPPENVAV
jgi:hypothetical protein